MGDWGRFCMSQYICALTILPIDRSVFKSFSSVSAGHFFELMKKIMGFFGFFNTAFKGLAEKGRWGVKNFYLKLYRITNELISLMGLLYLAAAVQESTTKGSWFCSSLIPTQQMKPGYHCHLLSLPFYYVKLMYSINNLISKFLYSSSSFFHYCQHIGSFKQDLNA